MIHNSRRWEHRSASLLHGCTSRLNHSFTRLKLIPHIEHALEISLQTDKGIPIGNLFEASTHSSVSVASELNYDGVSIHLECQLFCEFLSCHLMYFLTGRSICSIGRPLIILLMVPAKASTKKLSRLLRGTSDESRVTLPAKVGTLLQNNIGLVFKQIY